MAVNKLRPTANADNTNVGSPSRTGTYNEAYVLPVGTGRHSIALEGSYWTAGNATPGTALTAHAAPAIADAETKPIIHIYNGGSTDVVLDYIDILTTVANASATAVGFSIYTDAKGSTNRSSGGTAITPVNTRSNSTLSTGLTIYAGAVVAAGTSPKRVAYRTIKEFIGVALDRYSFSFGAGLMMTPTTSYTAGATAIVTYFPPVVLAPNGNLCFCQVSPSGATTAATFEFEMGYWDR